MKPSPASLAAWVLLLFIGSVPHQATAITLLHEFAGGANDGRHPFAGLTLSGSTLFGTTRYGGDHNLGTIFSILIPAPGGLVLVLTGFCVLAAYRGGRRGICES